MPDVMTVTGPVAAADLGFTHSHEHVLWDYWNLIPSYAHVHDDEAVAIRELAAFAAAGGGSLVDCSTRGIWDDPVALRRVSEGSGVKIVAGTGWYRERVYPPLVFESTINQLTDHLVNEIGSGMSGTDVRPGVIGEIGTERGHVSPAEERVFRAAARAARETGVAVITHTTHFGELALDQIDILADEGLSPDRIVISHLGDRVDTALLMAIARRGVHLSIDNIGYTGDGYPSDDVRAANVLALAEAGHGDQVVLGSDIAATPQLATYGGHGYAALARSFIPLLRRLGADEDLITKVTTTNIATVLARR